MKKLKKIGLGIKLRGPEGWLRDLCNKRVMVDNKKDHTLVLEAKNNSNSKFESSKILNDKEIVQFSTETSVKTLTDFGIFLGPALKKLESTNDFVLGIRKSLVIFDVEKSVSVYEKALSMIKLANKSKSKILFTGAPDFLEDRIERILIKSRHFYISKEVWASKYLKSKDWFNPAPDLIVCYKNDHPFSIKDNLKRKIPVISFVNTCEDTSLADYPLLLNLQSKGVAEMFLAFVAASII